MMKKIIIRLMMVLSGTFVALAIKETIEAKEHKRRTKILDEAYKEFNKIINSKS